MLEAVDLPPGKNSWLEPCAGSGNIIRAVQMYLPQIRWRSWEIREDCRSILESLDAAPAIGDFLSPEASAEADVAVMNPPFRLAQPFIEKCLASAPVSVVLLRLNYLASAKRSSFMRRHCPDIYVLPDRPSFSGDSKADSIEYAWFVFHREPRSSGRISVLAPTPLDERRF